MADTNNEPATKHDTTEGGIIGAVGGAIVGGLAGGPIGAVIGAVVGGAASAAAVHQVDKHDHDYSGAEYTNSADSVVTDSMPNYNSSATTPVVPAMPVAPAYTPPVAALATSSVASSHRGTDYNAATATRDNGNDVVIPIVEEEFQVGKRVEQTGGTRVHTTVMETPVSESVNLREEHVTVNRVAVDRAATTADFGTGAMEFTMTETREVPVVSKESRVVEEVVVGKTATEHTETVHDTVRRTDVQVDDVTTKGTTY